MEIFALLLESGLPFDDALKTSFHSYEVMMKALENGVPFSQIIRQQPSKRMRQLGVFMERFSLQEALRFDQRLRQSRQSLYGSLLKKSAYPLFLMAFATGLIWFFSVSIVPALMGGGADHPILQVLKAATALFWAAIGITALMMVWMLKGPGDSKLAANVLFRFSLMRYLCSMEAASLFECAQACGMSSRAMMELAKEAGCFPFGQLLWKRWQKQLDAGWPLMRCIEEDRRLDPLFARFFSVGSSGLAMESMMQAYAKSSAFRFEKKLSKISNALLYTAYGFVGVLALSLYQIMLEPLSMLEMM